jgi:hypothetical protein
MLYLSEMEEIADADPGGGACPEVGVAVMGCNPAPIPPPPPPKGCKGAEEKKSENKNTAKLLSFRKTDGRTDGRTDGQKAIG